MTKDKTQAKGVGFNISMLYIMNIAKLIFPLITLPYLTRVLSVDCYGVVSYVKATMVYAQLIIDFGFMLSGVKEITQARDNLGKVSRITGNVVLAKTMLSIASFAVIMCAAMFIPILKENLIFTMVSFVPIALTTLLLDFLFRGLEQMHIITLRYVVMRGITVVLTFVLVRSDADIMWIPVLDIIGTIVAIALVMYETYKLGIKLDFVEGIKGSWASLKMSGIYFVSEAATTVFGAFNTILVGIFLCKRDVAYWALCLQLVAAVKAMYTPVTNGIYPKMIQTKDIGIIKKSLKLFMPLIVIGCLITLVGAELILTIVGSAKYVAAAPTMRALVPVLFFCFPAMLFGWPTLGAIDRVNETTKTTLSAAGVQLLGLGLLGLIGQFNLIGVALVKSFTEFSLMGFRLRYCYKYKDEFTDNRSEEKISMKGILLKVGNAIGKPIMKLSAKTRSVVMYACLTLIMLSCYIYQIDDYTQTFIYPAMLNAAIGTLVFTVLIIIGIDREYTEADFDKRWIIVLFVFIAGLMVVISGCLHYIGYSYIAMGLVMMFLIPAYCLVWGDEEHLSKIFNALAKIIIVLFVIYFIAHVLIIPRSAEAFYLAGRYMGMSGNPNGIAKTAMTAYFGALYLLGVGKTKKRNLFAVVMGMALAMLIMTASRANLLAVFAITLFYLCVKIKNNGKEKEQAKKFLVSAIITVAIIAIAIPVSTFCLQWNTNRLKEASVGLTEIEVGYADRIDQGVNNDGSADVDGISSGRIEIWSKVIKEGKLFGNDMRSYEYVTGEKEWIKHAHNTIFEFLNRSGWIAGIAFFLVELSSAIWVLVTVFSKKKVEDYQLFAVLGISAFGVVSLFDIVVLPFAKMTVFIFYICFAAMCIKENNNENIAS